MKQFIATNWYKLLTATAMLIFSCAFFVFAVRSNTAKAGTPNALPDSAPSPANTWIVVKGDTVYEVTWDEIYRSYKCEAVCNSLR